MYSSFSTMIGWPFFTTKPPGSSKFSDWSLNRKTTRDKWMGSGILEWISRDRVLY